VLAAKSFKEVTHPIICKVSTWSCRRPFFPSDQCVSDRRN